MPELIDSNFAFQLRDKISQCSRKYADVFSYHDLKDLESITFISLLRYPTEFESAEHQAKWLNFFVKRRFLNAIRALCRENKSRNYWIEDEQEEYIKWVAYSNCKNRLENCAEALNICRPQTQKSIATVIKSEQKPPSKYEKRIAREELRNKLVKT